MKLRLVCPECDKSFNATYDPGSEPIASGPPEKCDPGSDSEWYPTECPHCGVEIEEDTVIEQLPEPPDRDYVERYYEKD